MTILSRWDRPIGCSLTLDLGVYSLSDRKHAFRDHCFSEGYPYNPGKSLHETFHEYQSRSQELFKPVDDCPGWAKRNRDGVSLQARGRVVSTVADSRRPHYVSLLRPQGQKRPGRLPKVECITGLCLRRNYSRIISQRMLRKVLEESLTGLQWIRHEKWYDVDAKSRTSFQKG